MPQTPHTDAMGLGGYLAAKSDAEHYHAERNREETEVTEKPEAEVAEVAEVFRSYGLTEDESRPIVDGLRKRPDTWVDFMMRFELGLEKPNPKRALLSALTIAGAYIVGGFIPLGPYIFLPKASTALVASVAITLLALAVFGYVKGHFTGAHTDCAAVHETDWRIPGSAASPWSAKTLSGLALSPYT